MSEKLVTMNADLSKLLESVGKEDGIEDVMASWQARITEATSEMTAEFGSATTIKEMHDLLVRTEMITLDRIGISGLDGMGRYRPKVLLRGELTQEQMTHVLSKLGIAQTALDAVPDIARLSPTEYYKPHKYGDELVGVPTQVSGVFCNVTMDAAKNFSNIELAFDPGLFMANE